MLVMHDLLAHINRSTVKLERFFNSDHSAVNAGAIAAWRS
jgi:hypothetical protein